MTLNIEEMHKLVPSSDRKLGLKYEYHFPRALVVTAMVIFHFRISELEDTLRSKSIAEQALEQQKQACDCHVIGL